MTQSLAGLLSDYAAGRLLPTAAIEAAIASAQSCRHEIRAFAEIDGLGARLSAAVSDYRYRDRTARALEGIPVAVKDLFDTAGLATRYGSPAYSENMPSADAEVIRTLRKRGAAIIGKTTTHEFAWGVTTASEHFGDTLNPRDHSKIPGGSSGGMAAAIAYGTVSAGLGTDTGGSVRIPAALCGVVGFKPTYGLLSTQGVFPLAPSLDHVGVMGRSVGDVEIVASALGIRSDTAPRTSRYRIGIAGKTNDVPISSDVQRSLEKARVILEPHYDVVEVGDLPSFKRGFEVFAGIVLAEGGMVHFSRHDREYVKASYGSETASRLAIAEQTTIGTYADSQQARRAFVHQLDNAMADLDFMLLPTCPCTAPALGADRITMDSWSGSIREALMIYTAPFNLAGMPALSLPTFQAEADGMPVGLQIAARRGGDYGLLAFASEVEAHLVSARPS
ncbi:amidase [Rhizobium leguminosarum]|uniref:amidase n=1 Tax=Rhizobium leguminosarum TaxID=384 RepID=UPI001C94170F|nr:amidase [Rhizobium leguminosarum]MBY5779399.1 amidase [Rhizobium leguminosarum]